MGFDFEIYVHGILKLYRLKCPLLLSRPSDSLKGIIIFGGVIRLRL